MNKIDDIERLRRRIEMFNPEIKEVSELRDYLLDVMELLWKRKKK